MSLEREAEPIEPAFENHLHQATQMTEWFPDYVFGIIDEPKTLPALTEARLIRQFGSSSSDNLRLICDDIASLPGDAQPDVAAYLCGFPEKELEAMLQLDISTILRLLDDRFPPPARSRYQDVTWQDDAICSQTDPEAFFPEIGESSNKAKNMCLLGCEAVQRCLVYALQNREQFGIWGGHSVLQRKKMLDEELSTENANYELAAENAIAAARAKLEARAQKRR
jgi:WhiB family redox-sensing transcriptional regulator